MIKRITRQQNMACSMLFRESGKLQWDICAGLPQTEPHVFRKTAERFSEVQIRGVNEFDQGV